MSTADLLERIEALSPEEREKAEAYVAFLARDAAGRAGTPDPLVERIIARRERIRAAVGSLDNHRDIRDLRENGPR
ncbi:MAG: hypothetical protein ABI672_22155 [Vicinamibacteria bacterium]